LLVEVLLVEGRFLVSKLILMSALLIGCKNAFLNRDLLEEISMSNLQVLFLRESFLD